MTAVRPVVDPVRISEGPRPTREHGAVLRYARAVLNLDSVIYAFGTWTIGYLVALAFGLGWYFALAFGFVAGGCLILFARRWPIPRFDTSTERADAVPLTVVAAVVLVWPIALDVGRVAVAVVALALLALRALVPALGRRLDRHDARLLVVGAIALLATLAFSWSWSAFVMLLCLVALGTILRPRWSGWFSDPADEAAATALAADVPAPSVRVQPAYISTAILAGLGVLIGVWHAGVNFWNPDNTYYINKAAHYADSPTTFAIRDYLYGFEDATHYPYGDILSSYETLLGTLSAITGVSVVRLLFQLAVPVSLFLLPFASRYAARGIGLRRANLVGGFAAAATLLMTATVAPSLFVQGSLGKTIGRLVFIPLLIGAAGYLLRRKDPGSAMRATLACVCAVGLSPTLAFAAALILAPFTAAGLWDLRPTSSGGMRARLPALVCLSTPLVFVGVYSLVAHLMQESAGSSQFLVGPEFAGPLEAWEFAVGRESSDYLLTLLFLVGAVAVFPLLLRSDRFRRAGALLLLLVFGVFLAPWFFEPLVNDVLDLNYFAFRFVWALPLALLIGVALANMDGRRTIGLLTVAAATLGLGLSGPDDLPARVFLSVDADVRDAPAVWPWDAGIPPPQRRTAAAVVAATPEGGRFLAPPGIEEAATATQIDRFPVYARHHYVTAVGRADSVPAEFYPAERELLSLGMSGASKQVEASRWREALERVDVATVCMDQATAPGLRQVVMETYVDRGPAAQCEIWTRPTF
jgi:hypothetical protein